MLFFPDAASALEPAAVTNLFYPADSWQLSIRFNNEITIEYALPAFPMGLKSHLAIRLLSKGHVSLDGASKLGKIDEPAQREQKDQKQQTKPPELDVWRDGLLATFEHGVTIVVFYHPAKHKLELKCLYALELPASFNNEVMKEQKTPEHLLAKPIPELALAEPLHILHQLINHEAIQGTNKVLPLLLDERSDHHMRDAIFHKVPGYKTMEVTSNKFVVRGEESRHYAEFDGSADSDTGSGKQAFPVYLSYAWGNEDSKHQQINDAIAAGLAKESSIKLMRDRDVMKTGESIEAFERDIGRGYQVIVIYSAKSLQSEHCMRELVYLQQTSLKNKDDFQCRVIPVILGDANIKDTLSIAEHENYWIEQAEKLENISSRSKNPTMADLKLSYREIANTLASSLHWSADILLDRTWQDKTPYDLTELVNLVKQRIEENRNASF